MSRLSPQLQHAEADAALAALDALNVVLASGAALDVIATPSPASCSECPFQIICPAFWRRLAEDGMPGLVDVAIEGELVRLEDGSDGDLYTAYILMRLSSNQTVGRWRTAGRTAPVGSWRSALFSRWLSVPNCGRKT
jgi:hypothetical protein